MKAVNGLAAREEVRVMVRDPSKGVVEFSLRSNRRKYRL